jgi:hypothetical protein
MWHSTSSVCDAINAGFWIVEGSADFIAAALVPRVLDVLPETFFHAAVFDTLSRRRCNNLPSWSSLQSRVGFYNQTNVQAAYDYANVALMLLVKFYLFESLSETAPLIRLLADIGHADGAVAKAFQKTFGMDLADLEGALDEFFAAYDGAGAAGNATVFETTLNQRDSRLVIRRQYQDTVEWFVAEHNSTPPPLAFVFSAPVSSSVAATVSPPSMALYMTNNSQDTSLTQNWMSQYGCTIGAVRVVSELHGPTVVFPAITASDAYINIEFVSYDGQVLFMSPMLNRDLKRTAILKQAAFRMLDDKANNTGPAFVFGTDGEWHIAVANRAGLFPANFTRCSVWLCWPSWVLWALFFLGLLCSLYCTLGLLFNLQRKRRGCDVLPNRQSWQRILCWIALDGCGRKQQRERAAKNATPIAQTVPHENTPEVAATKEVPLAQNPADLDAISSDSDIS